MEIFKTTANKKVGYTLAEVLIVLVIIGVVAALVITALVANTQKTQFVTGLQKANNILASAANHAQAESIMDTWNFALSSEEFTNTYLAKHLNIVKVCEDKAGCLADSYTTLGENAGPDIEDYYKFILTDGIAMGIKSAGEGGCTSTNPSVCATIVVDVNSTQGPNQWGKDLFAFNIYGGLNTIVPSGSFLLDDTGKWKTREASEIDTNCLSTGEYCAAKIANEGWEMNY